MPTVNVPPFMQGGPQAPLGGQMQSSPLAAALLAASMRAPAAPAAPNFNLPTRGEMMGARNQYNAARAGGMPSLSESMMGTGGSPVSGGFIGPPTAGQSQGWFGQLGSLFGGPSAGTAPYPPLPMPGMSTPTHPPAGPYLGSRHPPRSQCGTTLRTVCRPRHPP